jgi:hypothetical protein
LKRFRLLRTRRMRPSSRRAADNRVPNDHLLRNMSRLRPPAVAPCVSRSAFRPIATETQTLQQVRVVPLAAIPTVHGSIEL